jgi:hypothetical protein
MISKQIKALGVAAAVAGLSVAVPHVAPAADQSAADGSYVTREELRALTDAVQSQKHRLAEQERLLAEQARKLEAQANEIAALKATRVERPVQASFVTPVIPKFDPNWGATQIQDSEKKPEKKPPPKKAPEQPVGEAPKATEEAPSVAIASDVSVLTKKGQLSVEPQLEFANSTVNRFTFQGIEIVDTVLLGLIEATQASRDSYSAALGLRLGAFHRFEVDTRIPYLYRDDRITQRFVSLGDASITNSIDGDGLGDVEVGAHYQINNGTEGWPFFVGNVKVKTDTGEGPFDVAIDANGALEDLPTGSGFWSVQPSLTVIYPSDPAVFFGNLGYIFSIAEDIDRTIGSSVVGEVDPGDAFVLSFGMGISLNDLTSISFGYEHNFIGKTTQQLDGREVSSETLQVGALTLGFSYRALDDLNLNLAVQVGVTDDSPDVKLSLRTPISFQLY